MTDEQQTSNRGYAPRIIKKGYQSQDTTTSPTSDPKPEGGYVPTSTGDNPANTPTPPSDE